MKTYKLTAKSCTGATLTIRTQAANVYAAVSEVACRKNVARVLSAHPVEAL